MDKNKLRALLESDIKEVTISLYNFIRWCEEDEWMEEQLDQMESALERIVKGEGDPKEIAIKALKQYRGED